MLVSISIFAPLLMADETDAEMADGEEGCYWYWSLATAMGNERTAIRRNLIAM